MALIWLDHQQAGADRVEVLDQCGIMDPDEYGPIAAFEPVGDAQNLSDGQFVVVHRAGAYSGLPVYAPGASGSNGPVQQRCLKIAEKG